MPMVGESRRLVYLDIHTISFQNFLGSQHHRADVKIQLICLIKPTSYNALPIFL